MVKVFLHIKHRETGEVRILEKESDTYAEARDALSSQVEDDWFKLHWMTDQLDYLA